MRDFKFRGKDRDGRWFEGDLLSKASLSCIVCGYTYKLISYPNTYSVDDVHIVLPKTVGQYTGLCDVNKAEIWEDDLLRNKAWIGTFRVVFDNGVFVAVNTTNGRAYMEAYYFEESYVIGNIHDNEELAKGDNNVD